MLKQIIKFIGLCNYKVERLGKKYLRNRTAKKMKCLNLQLGEGLEMCAFPEHIHIGKNSYINGGRICASPNAKIYIGDNCLISYNVHMRTDMHSYEKKDKLIREQEVIEKDIIIKDDVWIGYGVQIMSGVTIETGCVIGAGAVVTKNTKPFGVYVGVPARKIKERTK